MSAAFRQFVFQVGGGGPSAVRPLLTANIVVGLAMWLMPDKLDNVFGALLGLSWEGLRHGFVWQLVTYMFLHGSGGHLMMNMFGLWMLGPHLENRLGTRAFWVLYFLSGILGGIGFVLIDPVASCIGASGAVFGILGAFAALFPRQPMSFLFFPGAALPAWQMVLMFGIAELLYLIGGDGSIAHSAHLAGGIAGYFFARFAAGHGLEWRWNPALRRRREARTKEEFRREEDALVNGILDKIAQEGLGSLTPRERAILDRASRERGELGR